MFSSEESKKLNDLYFRSCLNVSMYRQLNVITKEEYDQKETELLDELMRTP